MKRVILNHLILNHKYDIMITVQELIDALSMVEDKSKEVELGIFVEGISTFRDIAIVEEGSYDVTIWETPHNNVITKED